MPDRPLALGIDFGGTSIKIGVVSDHLVIDYAPPIATQDFAGPTEILVAMERAIEDLRARHPGIASIGIGVPGFVDFQQGIVHRLTNVRGWNQVPLKALLASSTGLPVVVENDANCMTYAEWKLGAGRGLDDLIAVTLGTGVGGGVIANRQIVRGARFGAGEIGQMSIDWNGPPGHYGNRGALENFVGNQQIAAMGQAAYLAVGINRQLPDCTPAALAAAANAKDPVAIGVWNQVAAALASTLMSCCWLLNPQALIIGGGVAKAGDLLFAPLTANLYNQLSEPFKEPLMVLPARFSNDAGMIGAATLSLEQTH